MPLLNKEKSAMNGKRYFLDTNAIIALLNGDNNIAILLNEAEWVGISVINKLEFLSFPNLSISDLEIFQKFISKVNVIPLTNDNDELHTLIVHIRNKYKLKLPDAIIAATTVVTKSKLITGDKAFFKMKEILVEKL